VPAQGPLCSRSVPALFPLCAHKLCRYDPVHVAKRIGIRDPRRHPPGGLNAAAEPDPLLLLAKVLIDYLSMRNDFAAVERLLVLMQGGVAAASPRWQAAWWRLAAQNLEYLGHADPARVAAQQLQQLAAP